MIDRTGEVGLGQTPLQSLLWVSKSLDKLTCALAGMGHAISPNSVRKLLTELGYSRQANRKADEGSHHPDTSATVLQSRMMA